MASLNKVNLIGHLGQDPEVRFLPSGQAVANFSMATSDKWKGKDGEMNERTEWHRVTVYGKLAEICRDFLIKGRQVYVEGRLQTKDWTDKEGIKRKQTEIIASEVIFLGSGKSERASSSSDLVNDTFPGAETQGGGPWD